MLKQERTIVDGGIVADEMGLGKVGIFLSIA
jgi:SNF2 family DNA or RNA helicase